MTSLCARRDWEIIHSGYLPTQTFRILTHAKPSIVINSFEKGHDIVNNYYMKPFFKVDYWKKNIDSRTAKAIHCAQNVKTVRLCTEFNKSMNNIFLICHILWHFQDGRH